MAITRTQHIDDDGSGTTGTVLNNAERQLLYDQIDAALVTTASGAKAAVSVVTTSGTIAALPIPVGSGNLIVLMNAGAPAVVNGIAPGIDGQHLTVYAYSNQMVSFGHMQAVVNNRLINWATSAATPIMGTGSASYFFEAGNGWRMVAHEQGAWITPPYSAADFTGSSGSVTVEAGDVQTFQYRLSGRTLSVVFNLNTISLATPGLQILIKIPGGFISTTPEHVLGAVVLDNSLTPVLTGYMQVVAGGTTIYVEKQIGGVYQAATNSTYIRGAITFQVN